MLLSIPYLVTLLSKIAFLLSTTAAQAVNPLYFFATFFLLKVCGVTLNMFFEKLCYFNNLKCSRN